MRWSAAEAAEIVEAARRATVHSARKPWVLELHGRSVYLYEIAHRSPYDPLGVDRLLSCGGALEHIVLAIRTAGWHAKVAFLPERSNPELIAVVRADRSEPPTPEELDCHRAIRLPEATGDGDAGRFATASRWAGTTLHPVDPDTLVVLTVDDRRSDQVRAGAALHAALLTARAAGVSARPEIHLTHRAEWRADLVERHGLAGHPQALLSVGAVAVDSDHRVVAGPTTASRRRTDS